MFLARNAGTIFIREVLIFIYSFFFTIHFFVVAKKHVSESWGQRAIQTRDNNRRTDQLVTPTYIKYPIFPVQVGNNWKQSLGSRSTCFFYVTIGMAPCALWYRSSNWPHVEIWRLVCLFFSTNLTACQAWGQTPTKQFSIDSVE